MGVPILLKAQQVLSTVKSSLQSLSFYSNNKSLNQRKKNKTSFQNYIVSQKGRGMFLRGEV